MSVGIANFLTAKEVAELLGVTPSRVRQIKGEGHLNPTKIGSQLFFDRREVAKFSRKNRPVGRPKKNS